MPYVSYSLKYRPQTFEAIVGQQHVTRTLMNALASGRIAHAYVFAGPRGTGKTSTARVFAKALNCLASDGPTPTPCGVCEMCVAIQHGRAMGVIEMDAASNRGIDDIRDLREKVKYRPAEGRCKVYILDEFHMLTAEAFNALLKTLEEPPEQTYFVLATTDCHRVPATILSRCQRFDFRSISLRDMAQMLRQIANAEGVQIEDAALMVVAQAAQGAMRDAESILDQIVAYAEGPVTVETVNAVLGVTSAELLARAVDSAIGADLRAAFHLVDELVATGRDLGQFIADLTGYVRDLLRVASGAEAARWLELGENGRERMRAQAARLGYQRLADMIRTLGAASSQLRATSQQTLLVELTLTQLCAETALTARPEPEAPPVSQTAGASAEPAGAPAAGAAAPASTAPAEQAPARTAGLATQTGSLSLESLRRLWAEALPLELRRMNRVAVGALTPEACPLELHDDVVVVALPEKVKGFHYVKLSGEHRPVVEEALERLTGRPLRLECRLVADLAQVVAGSGENAGPTAALAEPVGDAVAEAARPIAAEAPEDRQASDAPVSGSETSPQGPVELTLQMFPGSYEVGEKDIA